MCTSFWQAYLVLTSGDLQRNDALRTGDMLLVPKKNNMVYTVTDIRQK